MKSDSSASNQICLRCHSARIVVGSGGGSDSGDFVLCPEDQRKEFWRLQMGYLNFGGERTLCLDCGLVIGSVDPAKAKKIIQRHGSDELLARFSIGRE